MEMAANPLIFPLEILISLISGPLNEEFGWRGYALDRLMAKFGFLKGSLMLGFVWAIWHLPRYFTPGQAQYALMILAVFACSVIWSGVTAEIELVFLLFGLALVISVVNFLFDEFMNLSLIASYIVRYFVTTGIVMLLGFIVGWFFPSNFWMAFIYVGIVFVLAYAIDVFKLQKDISYINEHIRIKGEERIKQH